MTLAIATTTTRYRHRPVVQGGGHVSALPGQRERPPCADCVDASPTPACSHLIEVLDLINRKGAGLVSLKENLDTTTASGKLVFHMMASLAEFERVLMVERTQAGLAAAKARGVKLGRRRKLTPNQVIHGRALLASGETGHAVAQSLGVSRATLYRAIGPITGQLV